MLINNIGLKISKKFWDPTEGLGRGINFLRNVKKNQVSVLYDHEDIYYMSKVIRLLPSARTFLRHPVQYKSLIIVQVLLIGDSITRNVGFANVRCFPGVNSFKLLREVCVYNLHLKFRFIIVV